jgi:hypothetical protein
MNTKSRQQPIANERADQTDQQITDQSETTTLHHPAGEPACNNSNYDDDQKTLIGQVHDIASQRNARWLMLIDANSSEFNSAVDDLSFDKIADGAQSAALHVAPVKGAR